MDFNNKLTLSTILELVIAYQLFYNDLYQMGIKSRHQFVIFRIDEANMYHKMLIYISNSYQCFYFSSCNVTMISQIKQCILFEQLNISNAFFQWPYSSLIASFITTAPQMISIICLCKQRRNLESFYCQLHEGKQIQYIHHA